MFSSNPALSRVLDNTRSGTLTMADVVTKTGILLLITAVSFVLTWQGVQTGQLPEWTGMAGSITGFILGLIIIFGNVTNPLMIGLYGICQGMFLGAVSMFANTRFPGIATQAIAGTMAAFGVVLFLYSNKVLRATPMFTKVLSGLMLGILVLYITDIIASLCGHPLHFLSGNSNLSIGISLVIIGVASLSFVIDFNRIEEGIRDGLDERQGWRFAFGLLVGLVWLYLEILRLLIKLKSRD